MYYIVRDRGWEDGPTEYLCGFNGDKPVYTTKQDGARSFTEYHIVKLYQRCMKLWNSRIIDRTPKR